MKNLRRKKMFLKKEEKKKSELAIGMLIGAFAMLGVFSVTNKGKEMICEVKNKVSGLICSSSDKSSSCCQ